MIYDAETVKHAARGRWREIAEMVAGIGAEYLSGEHTPCPMCSESKNSDRFRVFADFPETGGAVCNQCGSWSDGFGFLQAVTGQGFSETVNSIGSYLGVDPHAKVLNRAAWGHSIEVRPAIRGKSENLRHLGQGDQFEKSADSFLATYGEGISKDALTCAGAELTIVRNRTKVISVPYYSCGQECGRHLYAVTQKDRFRVRGKEIKDRLAAGSGQGFAGVNVNAENATDLILAEGIKDCLAIASLPGFPSGAASVSQSNGAQARPGRFDLSGLPQVSSGGNILVVYDGDEAGRSGSENWSRALAEHYNQKVASVSLPDNKDARDMICSGEIKSYEDLLSLATSSPNPLSPGQEELADDCNGTSPQSQPGGHRSHKDPMRIASFNLDRFYRHNPGGILVSHRGSWFKWTQESACYEMISDATMEAHVIQSADALAHEVWASGECSGKTPPVLTSSSIISPALKSLSAMCKLSDRATIGRWLDAESARWVSDVREVKTEGELMDGLSLVNRHAQIKSDTNHSQPFVAVRNGILDINQVVLGGAGDQYLLRHDYRWFSCACLPYDYDKNATCPKFDRFIQLSVPDPTYRKILQEWAGYLILPECSEQKMMIIEGEGGNGKSVFCAAMQSLVGQTNYHSSSITQLASRFGLAQTIGKLLQVVPDAGEDFKGDTGTLRAFVSGDPMEVEQKNKQPYRALPTARVMISCNSRPKFSDNTNALWRRMLLVEFPVTIPRSKRISGMDTEEYWHRSGELPGILNWALEGAKRLMRSGFTSCEDMEDRIENYKVSSNTVLSFARDEIEVLPSGSSSFLALSDAYKAYRKWCIDTGNSATNRGKFEENVNRALKAKTKTVTVSGKKKTGWIGAAIFSETGQDQF